MWDFVMDKSGAGAGFLRVLRFPLPIFIPPIFPQSSSPIIWGWYNRPAVVAVRKVPPHKLIKKQNVFKKYSSVLNTVGRLLKTALNSSIMNAFYLSTINVKLIGS
jgi:hypothetical protein